MRAVYNQGGPVTLPSSAETKQVTAPPRGANRNTLLSRDALPPAIQLMPQATHRCFRDREARPQPSPRLVIKDGCGGWIWARTYVQAAACEMRSPHALTTMKLSALLVFAAACVVAATTNSTAPVEVDIVDCEFMRKAYVADDRHLPRLAQRRRSRHVPRPRRAQRTTTKTHTHTRPHPPTTTSAKTSAGNTTKRRSRTNDALARRRLARRVDNRARHCERGAPRAQVEGRGVGVACLVGCIVFCCCILGCIVLH